jgi:hypothetical protein
VQLARVATPESDVILLSRHQVQSLKINQFGGSLDGLLAEKKRRQNQAFERRVKAMNDYEVRSVGREGGREKWREGWTDTTYPSLYSFMQKWRNVAAQGFTGLLRLAHLFLPPSLSLHPSHSRKAKKAQALLLGQHLPKAPSAVSPHLLPSSDICLTDGGARALEEGTQQWCLFSVGFRSKHDATVPRSSDVEFPWQFIMCKYCLEHEGAAAGVRGGRRGQVKGDWKRPKFPSFEELHLHHHFRLCPYVTPKDQEEGPPSFLA